MPRSLSFFFTLNVFRFSGKEKWTCVASVTWSVTLCKERFDQSMSNDPKAVCTFCDTDFLGTDGTYGGKYKKASELAAQIKRLWPQSNNNQHYVVFTGGEPTLQLDSELIDACKALGLKVGIETNGTREVPEGVDWICVEIGEPRD